MSVTVFSILRLFKVFLEERIKVVVYCAKVNFEIFKWSLQITFAKIPNFLKVLLYVPSGTFKSQNGRIYAEKHINSFSFPQDVLIAHFIYFFWFFVKNVFIVQEMSNTSDFLIPNHDIFEREIVDESIFHSPKYVRFI